MSTQRAFGHTTERGQVMDLPEMINRAAQHASNLVAEIAPANLDAPSTCSEWDQRTLANHLTGFLPYSANAARRGAALEGDGPDFAAADTWAQQFAAMAQDCAAAWSEEGALDGVVQFGPGELPAEAAAGITLMELTLHAWDLAQSAGHTFTTDDDIAGAVEHIVANATQSGPSDFFGSPVAIESDDALERAVALSGRNPNRT